VVGPSALRSAKVGLRPSALRTKADGARFFLPRQRSAQVAYGHDDPAEKHYTSRFSFIEFQPFVLTTFLGD
jgi:hypothetical protein